MASGSLSWPALRVRDLELMRSRIAGSGHRASNAPTPSGLPLRKPAVVILVVHLPFLAERLSSPAGNSRRSRLLNVGCNGGLGIGYDRT
jgi:hypothetical protein